MAAKPLPDQAVLLQVFRYDESTGKLFWRDHPNRNIITGREALTHLTNKGYRRGGCLGRLVMAHRVIWKMAYGTEPQEIDHIDGDRSNNRLSNLRGATRQINNRNVAMRRSNTSGRIGVHPRKNGKWVATIRNAGKQICLGEYNDLQQAIEARAAAEIKYGYSPGHGRPARYGASV